MPEGTCPLCKKPAAEVAEAAWFRYTCKSCGQFRVSEELRISPHFARRAPLLSGITRNAFEGGMTLELTTGNFASLADAAPAIHDVETKAKMLLRHLVRRSKSPGEFVDLDTETDYPLCHASGDIELHFLLTTLKERGWIDWMSSTATQRIELTASGWGESTQAPRELSEKAFVAMWFDSKTDQAWLEGIKPAIEACGFRPVRIDFEEHNEMIDDRIQAEIRESRFLVVDLTGQRNGVYFEAGLALGREIPVVWTRARWDKTETHFDARQYNRIEYETPDQLRDALGLRIRATVGRGPLKVHGSGSQA